jgi:hypothetical protein
MDSLIYPNKLFGLYMDENDFYIMINHDHNSEEEYSEDYSDYEGYQGILDSPDPFFSCFFSLVSYISKIYTGHFTRR